jgi:hypothetical protein
MTHIDLKPFEGFTSLETHHCITGSMRHIYLFNDHPLSEDMLLGIGGGVGFIYWHSKGQAPFIGGRAKGNASAHFEQDVGKRTGVQIEEFSTTSKNKARSSLIDLLEEQVPVMLYVDMGFLPYFDFGGQEYHFGGHMVVVCGWNESSQMVLVADRDKALHPIPLADLEKARGSTYKPFPPKNRWFSFDFSQKRTPSQNEYRKALREQVDGALHPPISNLGVPGIRKAARLSLKWAQTLDEEMLRFTLFNTYIFIDAKGGTGGGIFRFMFSRFLGEAGQVLGQPAFYDIANDFKEIGDRWQEVAEVFHEGWGSPDPSMGLSESSRRMLEIAEMEEAAWKRLETAL